MTALADPPRTLSDRASRTGAVLAPFRPKQLDFAKKATCIHVARAMLVAFGHSMPLVPAFRTPQGAQRAMRKLGHRSLRTLLGAYVPEIPPAVMWVGDLALMEGEGIEAIVVSLGGGELFGWVGEDLSRMQAFRPIHGHAPIAAWRL